MDNTRKRVHALHTCAASGWKNCVSALTSGGGGRAAPTLTAQRTGVCEGSTPQRFLTLSAKWEGNNSKEMQPIYPPEVRAASYVGGHQRTNYLIETIHQ